MTLTEAEVRRIVAEAVNQTLTKIGIDPEEPIEFQHDMAYLRSWRVSVETMKRQSILTAIGIITTGFFGMLWMTFKNH